MPVANTLALAAVAPFSGSLGDLFGRRNITIIGALAICVGIVIVATAHSFAQVIAGMALSGAGAGIGELTALSGVGELVPVKKRGLYVGLVVAFLIPSTPYVMYSQLFSSRTDPTNYQGWRWGKSFSLAYSGALADDFLQDNGSRCKKL
jgi:MFS family permease